MTTTVSRELVGRAKVRAWIREVLEDVEELDMPALAEELVERIAMDAAVLRVYLYPAVYEEVKSEVAMTRNRRGGRRFLATGDKAMTEQELIRKAAVLESKWGRWLETVADHRTVLLLEMTRADLEAAATMRQERAQVDLDTAALLSALAERLGEGERVRQRWTPEEIETAWRTIQAQGTPEPASENREKEGEAA